MSGTSLLSARSQMTWRREYSGYRAHGHNCATAKGALCAASTWAVQPPALEKLTGIRSGNFERMRWDSAKRFSEHTHNNSRSMMRAHRGWETSRVATACGSTTRNGFQRSKNPTTALSSTRLVDRHSQQAAVRLTDTTQGTAAAILCTIRSVQALPNTAHGRTPAPYRRHAPLGTRSSLMYRGYGNRVPPVWANGQCQ